MAQQPLLKSHCKTEEQITTLNINSIDRAGIQEIGTREAASSLFR